MNPTDTVLGLDWSRAEYLGDGVYIQDAGDGVALRAPRERDDSVIMLGEYELETLERYLAKLQRARTWEKQT